MVASMLRAQRRDPAKAQAKCAFATNYPLANRQLRSSLILRYRMQRDKPFTAYPVDSATYNILWVVGACCVVRPSSDWNAAIGAWRRLKRNTNSLT